MDRARIEQDRGLCVLCYAGKTSPKTQAMKLDCKQVDEPESMIVCALRSGTRDRERGHVRLGSEQPTVGEARICMTAEIALTAKDSRMPEATGCRHSDVNVGGLGDVAAFQNFDIECLFEPEVV